MGKLIDSMLSDLDSRFDVPGRSPHMTVMESLQSVNGLQAAWALPGRNSIWKIVDHLALWKEYAADRMAGEPRRPRGWEQGIDWADITEITEAAWQAALQRLVQAQARIKAELARRTDEDLAQPLPGGKNPLRVTMRNVAAHDSYHCGQIHVIRALQGIPTEW